MILFCCWIRCHILEGHAKDILMVLLELFYLYLQNFTSDPLEALKLGYRKIWVISYGTKTNNNTSHLYFILLAFFCFFFFPCTNSFPHPTVLGQTYSEGWTRMLNARIEPQVCRLILRCFSFDAQKRGTNLHNQHSHRCSREHAKTFVLRRCFIF